MHVHDDRARLISELLDRADASDLVGELQERLDDEHQRRDHFYNWVDENTKAEFINGQIVVHSPVRKAHGSAVSCLFKLIDAHVDLHDLGLVGIEKLMIRLRRNDFEPDVCYFSRPTADAFTEDQTLFPAPTFIAEVLSPGTEARDRGVKYDDYAANGVPEYWIVDAQHRQVECYDLGEAGAYALRYKRTVGQDVSVAQLPGLTFPVAAIFDRQKNWAAVLELRS